MAKFWSSYLRQCFARGSALCSAAPRTKVRLVGLHAIAQTQLQGNASKKQWPRSTRKNSPRPRTAEGFKFIPKKSTPHLDCISTDPLDGAKALSAVCARCQETEVWICLKCHAPHCSRYKNGCCKKHAEESGHLIAVSLSDLSVWDYGQDCYLDVYAIPKLRAPYAALHLAKFGEAPSFPGRRCSSSALQKTTSCRPPTRLTSAVEARTRRAGATTRATRRPRVAHGDHRVEDASRTRVRRAYPHPPSPRRKNPKAPVRQSRQRPSKPPSVPRQSTSDIGRETDHRD